MYKLSYEDYLNIKTGKINVICFDFGHGESTVAKMEFSPTGTPLGVKALNTSDGGEAYKLPTYIFIPANGDESGIQIGENAFKSFLSDRKSGDFYSCFKCLPSYAGDYAVPDYGVLNGSPKTNRYLMRMFVQKYMDMVFD